MSFHWEKLLAGRKRKKTLGQGFVRKFGSYRSAVAGIRIQNTKHPNGPVHCKIFES